MTDQRAIAAYQDKSFADLDSAELVQTHAPLVRRIALHLIARLPSHVQVDDLVQAGMIGLLEAASKFDAGRGAAFTTYAGIRIRGAMVDEIRKGDWVPRSVHKHSRDVSQAMQRLEARLAREPTDREIAAELGLDLPQYYRILGDAAAGKLHSFETLLEDEQPPIGGSDDVAQTLESQELHERVADAIETLSEREQLVLSLYYEEGLNLKEIGLVIHVGESRVSQIMSKAVVRLRGWLSEQKSEDT